jgi:uncharacterized paraquat-inducible protein A
VQEELAGESAAEGLAEEAHVFRLGCPSCGHASRLPQTHLGRKVQCRRCGHEFTADWAEVIADPAALP